MPFNYLLPILFIVNLVAVVLAISPLQSLMEVKVSYLNNMGIHLIEETLTHEKRKP